MLGGFSHTAIQSRLLVRQLPRFCVCETLFFYRVKKEGTLLLYHHCCNVKLILGHCITTAWGLTVDGEPTVGPQGVGKTVQFYHDEDERCFLLRKFSSILPPLFFYLLTPERMSLEIARARVFLRSESVSKCGRMMYQRNAIDFFEENICDVPLLLTSL